MEKGYLSYGAMVEFAMQEGAKPSAAERRLRPSESPNIEAVMRKSKKGTLYIAGYSYRKPPEPKPEDRLKELIQAGMI